MKYSVTFRPTAGMDYVTDETGKDLSPHEIVAAIATLRAENARLRVLLARAADGLECAAHDLYSHNLDGTRYAQDVKAARALLDAEVKEHLDAELDGQK